MTTPNTTTINQSIETYFNGTDYITLTDADLTTNPLPSRVTGSPIDSIKSVKSTSFVIPAEFFGLHATAAGAAGLFTAGAKSIRSRDMGIQWYDLCKYRSAVTFSGGQVVGALNAATSYAYFTNSGGALPTGVTQYKPYKVNKTGSNYLLADLLGNSVTVTGTGSGTHQCIEMNTEAFIKFQEFAAVVSAGKDVLWDGTDTATFAATGNDKLAIPTSTALLIEWIGFLSYAFGSKLVGYEVWNEPNTPGYFNGTTANLVTYTNMVRQVRDFLAIPMKVVSPSYTAETGPALLSTFLTSGGSADIDVVAFHAYRGDQYLGFDTTITDAFLSAAATDAAGKDIWCTEVGESIPDEALLYRAHMYCAAKGVKRLYWYNADMALGRGDMRVSAYIGLMDKYKQLVSLAGQTVAYLNRTGVTGGKIGYEIAGAKYVK